MNYYQEVPRTTDHENSNNEIVSELQSKINQLQMELKQQQEAAHKGGKLLQLMWGHNFNSESLF